MSKEMSFLIEVTLVSEATQYSLKVVTNPAFIILFPFLYFGGEPLIPFPWIHERIT